MSTSSTVQTVANVASAKASEGIKTALLALTRRIIAEHYFDPVIRFAQHKYRESPLYIRLGMCASATVVVLPTACFIAMLLPAILGCVLVVGVVLLVIETLCFGFAVVVLVPMCTSAFFIVAGLIGILSIVVRASRLMVRVAKGLIRLAT
ncbi:hypothetical protein BGX34_010896 [Mortierella sp. NVP85]|nr:hypothetical protein BGX34_010896 [Mortierella sp. NVP85]